MPSTLLRLVGRARQSPVLTTVDLAQSVRITDEADQMLSLRRVGSSHLIPQITVIGNCSTCGGSGRVVM